MKRRLSALFALLFASGAISSACLAAPKGEDRLVVRFDDLDLSKPDGVKALRTRLEHAAERTCLAAAGLEAGQQMDWACVADAMAAAMSRVPSAISEQQLSKSRRLAKSDPH